MYFFMMRTGNDVSWCEHIGEIFHVEIVPLDARCQPEATKEAEKRFPGARGEIVLLA